MMVKVIIGLCRDASCTGSQHSFSADRWQDVAQLIRAEVGAQTCYRTGVPSISPTAKEDWCVRLCLCASKFARICYLNPCDNRLTTHKAGVLKCWMARDAAVHVRLRSKSGRICWICIKYVLNMFLICITCLLMSDMSVLVPHLCVQMIHDSELML